MPLNNETKKSHHDATDMRSDRPNTVTLANNVLVRS